MLTRRSFVTSTVGAGAMLATQGPHKAAAQADRRMIVDAQVHLWKAETPDWKWIPGLQPQLPGGGPADEVSGPVHPGTWQAERAGHEPLRGQPRPVQVTAGQSSSGHIELTDESDRYRRESVVEDVRPGVPDRPAYRWRGPARR